MANLHEVIDRSTLLELRRHVKALLTNNGRGLLAREIVEFCSNLELGHGVTIARARALPESEQLTTRERQVAGLLCSGMANRDIAATLSISVATVKDHVHRILQKTGLRNRASLAACYVSASIPRREAQAHPCFDG